MTSSPLYRFHHLSPGTYCLPDDLTVAWQSPSNIALVKYWGKRPGQIPVNPSLSMTLQIAVTQTRVHVSSGKPDKGLVSVNNDPQHPFLPKMRMLLNHLITEIPILAELTFSAQTQNQFPHSTGIASSASGLSAFSLCILGVAARILYAEMYKPEISSPEEAKSEAASADFQPTGLSNVELYHMASYTARFGSGSACRSLYGGFTSWGNTEIIPGTSDHYAVSLTEMVHPEMLLLHDAILVVSGKPKALSSTKGHAAMNGHPFLTGRIKQANRNFSDALDALSTNDFEKLCDVAESEALTLHALLMSASQGTLLMQPATLEIINYVREARKDGLPVFFTLDAGANVHLLYPHMALAAVEKFIEETLTPLCETGRVIFDSCGPGPVELNEPVTPDIFRSL